MSFKGPVLAGPNGTCKYGSIMHVFFIPSFFFSEHLCPSSRCSIIPPVTTAARRSRAHCGLLLWGRVCLWSFFFFCRIFAVPVTNAICIYKQRSLKQCTPGDNANARADAQRGVYSKCLWQAYQHSDPLWQPHFTVNCKVSQVSTCYVTKKKCCPTKKVNWLSFCSDYCIYASSFSTFSAIKDIRILMKDMLHSLFC